MNEADLQNASMDLGYLTGHRMHHSRPARTSQGWRTAISGHAGFVDVVFAHEFGGIRLVEFKSATGRLTPDQLEWQRVLKLAAEVGTSYHVWRPSDWHDGTIEHHLMGNYDDE